MIKSLLLAFPRTSLFDALYDREKNEIISILLSTFTGKIKPTSCHITFQIFILNIIIIIILEM